MVSIQTDQDIVYTTAEGSLDDKDYDRIIPLLQEKIATFGKIRWYFEMRNFKGWTPGAMWKDLKFDFSNRDKFEKIAIVGDTEWEKYLTQLMKPFTSAEIVFFKEEDRERAKTWIREIR